MSPQEREIILFRKPLDLKVNVNSENENMDQLIGMKEVNKQGKPRKDFPGQHGEHDNKYPPEKTPEVIFQKILQQVFFDWYDLYAGRVS